MPGTMPGRSEFCSELAPGRQQKFSAKAGTMPGRQEICSDLALGRQQNFSDNARDNAGRARILQRIGFGTAAKVQRECLGQCQDGRNSAANWRWRPPRACKILARQIQLLGGSSEAGNQSCGKGDTFEKMWTDGGIIKPLEARTQPQRLSGKCFLSEGSNVNFEFWNIFTVSFSIEVLMGCRSLRYTVYLTVQSTNQENLKNRSRKIGTLVKFEKQKCQILSAPNEGNEFNIQKTIHFYRFCIWPLGLFYGGPGGSQAPPGGQKIQWKIDCTVKYTVYWISNKIVFLFSFPPLPCVPTPPRGPMGPSLREKRKSKRKQKINLKKWIKKRYSKPKKELNRASNFNSKRYNLAKALATNNHNPAIHIKINIFFSIFSTYLGSCDFCQRRSPLLRRLFLQLMWWTRQE